MNLTELRGDNYFSGIPTSESSSDESATNVASTENSTRSRRQPVERIHLQPDNQHPLLPGSEDEQPVRKKKKSGFQYF